MAKRTVDWTVATTLIAGAMAFAPGSAFGQDRTVAACPDNSFCDSFETDAVGAVPSAPWTFEINGEPTVEIDESDAFLGKKSVKITAKGRETAFLALKGAPVFPLADNIMYGRGMVKLESAPRKRVHWTIIEGKGTSPDGGHVIEYRYGGSKPMEKDGVYTGSRLMANYETPTGPKTDCWHVAKNETVMPTGRWMCLAWAFDGQQNSMKLWLDGKLLDDLSVTGIGQGCMGAPDDYNWQAPVFDQINLGWESYKEDEVRTVWIDDVAIGDQPLDCPDRAPSQAN